MERGSVDSASDTAYEVYCSPGTTEYEHNTNSMSTSTSNIEQLETMTRYE
jgi:hypothetical protein